MPFQKNGKRDYAREHQWELTRHPERKEQRAERNQARRELTKEGVIRKGDSRQVDHIKPLSKGGGNSRGNLRPLGAHANESYRRNKDGSIKGNRG